MMPTSGMKRKRGTKAQFDKAFAPVAVEIGHFARSWNELHEGMGLIFAALFESPFVGMPLACWHSIPDDGAKRRMLRAAVKAWPIRNKQIDKAVKEEIIWMLKEADALAASRNDALHAPINTMMDMATFQFSVEPNYFYGNPRATNLKGKDLKSEFSAYRAQSDALIGFSRGIRMYLAQASPLPSRPGLPNPVPHRSRVRPTRLTRPSQPT